MKNRIVVASIVCLGVASLAVAGDYYTKYKGDERKYGEPTDEMALVYVVRPANLGAAIRTWAFYDDQFIGVVRGNGYAFALVPPGKYVFWSKAENTSALELEVEAGKTYYFKQRILPGIGKARVKMQLVDEADGKKMMEECGYCEATEEGRQRAAEIAAERLDRAEKKAAKRAEKDKD